MNFVQVIEEITAKLDATEIRYALIGGFAMALRGVQRATVDLDFILMLDDWELLEEYLALFKLGDKLEALMQRASLQNWTNPARYLNHDTGGAYHNRPG